MRELYFYKMKYIDQENKDTGEIEKLTLCESCADYYSSYIKKNEQRPPAGDWWMCRECIKQNNPFKQYPESALSSK